MFVKEWLDIWVTFESSELFYGVFLGHYVKMGLRTVRIHITKKKNVQKGVMIDKLMLLTFQVLLQAIPALLIFLTLPSKLMLLILWSPCMCLFLIVLLPSTASTLLRTQLRQNKYFFIKKHLWHIHVFTELNHVENVSKTIPVKVEA